MAMYMLAGALHGVYDLDVTTVPTGKAVLSLADKSADHSDKGSLAEHHCHGCFSVSVSAPIVAAVDVVRSAEVIALPQASARGLPPGIDPPPPKFLT
jgi:hypothetical protein